MTQTESPIRMAALAALEQQRLADAAASRDALVTHARQVLGSLGLDAPDVAYVDQPNRLVVLSDGVTCLAVRGEEVRLVRGEDDGTWTDLGGPFTSLADLGAALEDA